MRKVFGTKIFITYGEHDMARPTLLQHCAALPEMPVRIVESLRDAVCPPAGAQALARAPCPGHADVGAVRGARPYASSTRRGVAACT